MRYTILILMVILFSAATGYTQPEVYHVKKEGVPTFSYELGNVASDDPNFSGLLVYIKIPFEDIQFIRISDTLFQAEVELAFSILDEEGDQVDGHSFTRKIDAQNYDQTTSNRVIFTFRTQFDLPPDEYTVVCELTDMDTKKVTREQKKIELRDFSHENLSMSDPIILKKADLNDEEINKLYRYFPDVKSDSTNFSVAALEIYSTSETEKIKVDYDIIDFRNKQVQDDKIELEKEGFRTPVFIPLFHQNLSYGNYQFHLKIDDGKNKKEMERQFRMMDSSLPVVITNLDEAIKQMQYIADKSDIEKIENAPDTLKRTLFYKYWKSQDPTPNTDTNELMNEYYRRVAYSNSHFSGFQDGWKTDMGMIYILYGPPNEVSREPYNAAADPYGIREVYAYELWYYYNYNRRFIFIDERGFGDFRLVNLQDVYRY